MEDVESLSEILGDTPFSTGDAAKADPAPPAVELEEEVQPKEPETKVDGDAAPAAEASIKPEDQPGKEDADGRSVALKVARDRYRKAEERLKELESKPVEKVSIFDDEERGIAQRIAEQSRPLREANFNMSLKLARLTYKDAFEKAEGAFFDSAEADPRLYDQMRASADPGEFIFTVGTQIAELAPVGGDFVKYREKVTGELKTELSKRDEQIKALSAQLEALTKSQKELDDVPRSLNSSQSSAAPKATDADPEDINSIVRFNN